MGLAFSNGLIYQHVLDAVACNGASKTGRVLRNNLKQLALHPCLQSAAICIQNTIAALEYDLITFSTLVPFDACILEDANEEGIT